MYHILLRVYNALLLMFISFGYVTEDVSKRVWNDSSGLWGGLSARHGVSFASAGLAVREDRSIVALQNLVHYRPGGLAVDVHLGRVRVEYRVEGKNFRWLPMSRVWVLYSDLGIQSVHFYYVFGVSVKLFGAQRPNSHHHPDIFYLPQFRRAILNTQMSHKDKSLEF